MWKGSRSVIFLLNLCTSAPPLREGEDFGTIFALTTPQISSRKPQIAPQSVPESANRQAGALEGPHESSFIGISAQLR